MKLSGVVMMALEMWILYFKTEVSLAFPPLLIPVNRCFQTH